MIQVEWPGLELFVAGITKRLIPMDRASLVSSWLRCGELIHGEHYVGIRNN